jgi:hypothetical protein
MKPKNEEQKLTASQAETSKLRLTIEKLEERIAPARGYPGPPDHSNGGGDGPQCPAGRGNHCGR